MVALYVKLAVVVPRHTEGFDPNVMVGNGLTVTTELAVAVQPPLAAVTVTV